MFELILMRHAKSDWRTNLRDIDRPLNARGIDDAALMGEHLLKLNLVPDSIIVSSAERTQQTAGLLLDSFNADTTELIISDELYLASPETMLKLIKNHAQENQRLMLLAHNPGIDELVMYLSSSPPQLTTMGKLMVTCATAVFQIDSLNDFLDESPDDLKQQGCANLVALLRPKEIT